MGFCIRLRLLHWYCLLVCVCTFGLIWIYGWYCFSFVLGLCLDFNVWIGCLVFVCFRVCFGLLVFCCRLLEAGFVFAFGC